MSQMAKVFDFESTLGAGEGLDMAAELVGGPALGRQMSELTDAAMSNGTPFRESLRERVGILIRHDLHEGHLDDIAEQFRNNLAPSVKAHADWFPEHTEELMVASGGFGRCIGLALDKLGVPQERRASNHLTLVKQPGRTERRVSGFDERRIMSRDGGKAEVVRRAKRGLLIGDVAIIGDGGNDLLVRKMGVAKWFIAFTEIKRRDEIVAQADYEAGNFADLLKIFDNAMLDAA